MNALSPSESETSAEVRASELATPARYAGFWPRLLANLIDSLVFVPMLALYLWVSSSKTAALALLLPMNAFMSLYSVFMHARWGKTLGKMLAGIRVVALSGAAISWRQALLRDSVNVVLVATSTASMLVAIVHFPEGSWHHDWHELAIRLNATEPRWGAWARAAAALWFWSELLVLLFNAKRRALHDLIAGTVVIREPSKSVVSSSGSECR